MTLNDLARLFHDKMRFRPALLESERVSVILIDCFLLSGIHAMTGEEICVSQITLQMIDEGQLN